MVPDALYLLVIILCFFVFTLKLLIFADQFGKLKRIKCPEFVRFQVRGPG